MNFGADIIGAVSSVLAGTVINLIWSIPAWLKHRKEVKAADVVLNAYCDAVDKGKSTGVPGESSISGTVKNYMRTESEKWLASTATAVEAKAVEKLNDVLSRRSARRAGVAK